MTDVHIALENWACQLCNQDIASEDHYVIAKSIMIAEVNIIIEKYLELSLK